MASDWPNASFKSAAAYVGTLPLARGISKCLFGFVVARLLPVVRSLTSQTLTPVSHLY